MTRIDFHSNVSNKLNYVCRLVHKAYVAQARAIILTPNPETLTTLNKALWTFTELEFIPHVTIDDPLAAQTPIVLATPNTTEFPHHEVLINLTPDSPADFAQFERVIEIISKEEQDVIAGRERYKFYKQRGYPLQHFVRQ